ncbi:hypothetical protein CK203_027047 [Vitis vinifera]|uniref:Uncharacterized protein n=1 Tax=Vitis vinifera TaxID=29760 RepID=A0A438HPG7_VITVI|nr:hypothetical protein CK203_035515 [Vitis vinifera]RVW87098.1 hypothetical protein CK203_027047 [Vitis vinifera]
MVRYSNQDFFGIPETYTGYLMWNNRNSTESSSRRDAGALALIYELVEKASNSERMFEPREVRVAYYGQYTSLDAILFGLLFIFLSLSLCPYN